MAITSNKKFWTEFINIYHSLPSLWNTKDENYNNRECRNAAWNKLVEKLQEVEPDANQDSVKRKINTFRSNFNREVRKICQTQREQGVDVYNPTLWYFNHLSFLLKHDKYNGEQQHYEEETTTTTLLDPTTTKCEILLQNETSITEQLANHQKRFSDTEYETSESNNFNHTTIKKIKLERPPGLYQEQETNLEYTTLTNITDVMETEATSSNSKEIIIHSSLTTSTENETNHLIINENHEKFENLTPRKVTRSGLNKKAKLRLKSQNPYNRNHLSSMKSLDEASIYGQSWACGFRKLSAEQKLYAKKAIDEILILGQLNSLKLQTVPMNTTLLERKVEDEKQDYNKSLNKNS